MAFRRDEGNDAYKNIPEIKGLRGYFLVRRMGLEPIRSLTRTSNVPVCQFQHRRAQVLL